MPILQNYSLNHDLHESTSQDDHLHVDYSFYETVQRNPNDE